MSFILTFLSDYTCNLDILMLA